MIIPFFLTRQTANLMEDFAREVKDGPALFLLYGENGVGKTRLLQELCQSRFSERRIHWLDLGSGDSADGTRLDYSHGIEELFDKADNGDIIIADHFDEALKKTRHQLFLSWSTDGIDKNLNLIIGSSNEGFNELRQLSQQYQVRVQSFQQMPFTADEVESFLGFCLFPDQPAMRLRIPGPVRKQLAETRGNVGQLIDVIQHCGKQIKSASASDSQSIRQGSKMVVAVLLLFVVAVGAGWFYLQGPFVADNDSLVATPPQAEAQAQTQAPAPAAGEEYTGTGDDAADESTTAAVTTIAAVTDSAPADNGMEPEGVPEAVPGAALETPAEVYAADATDAPPEAAASDVASTEDEPVEVAAGAESAAEPAAEPADQIAAAPPVEASNSLEESATWTALQAEAGIEPGTASESEAVIDESVAESETVDSADAVVDSEAVDSADASVASSAEEVARLDLAETDAVPPRSNRDRFARELGDSGDWIRQHDDAVGTIQILLLTFDTFDADVYYQYVANLARKNVDVDKLHVFKTLTGNKEVYSVFYGEYASRSAALRAIDELPEVLRDTSPIPRSVGGIWQEIRRLENEN